MVDLSHRRDAKSAKRDLFFFAVDPVKSALASNGTDRTAKKNLLCDEAERMHAIAEAAQTV